MQTFNCNFNVIDSAMNEGGKSQIVVKKKILQGKDVTSCSPQENNENNCNGKVTKSVSEWLKT